MQSDWAPDFARHIRAYRAITKLVQAEGRDAGRGEQQQELAERGFTEGTRVGWSQSFDKLAVLVRV